MHAHSLGMLRGPLHLSPRAVTFLSQKPPQLPLPRLTNLLGGVSFPSELPFGPDCFSREDETDDSVMYARYAAGRLCEPTIAADAAPAACRPIMVTHIDEEAITGLTKHYTRTLPRALPSGNTVAHLDLCSSWVSFLPVDYKPERCVGLGMNSSELQSNTQLTEALVSSTN